MIQKKYLSVFFFDEWYVLFAYFVHYVKVSEEAPFKLTRMHIYIFSLVEAYLSYGRLVCRESM